MSVESIIAPVEGHRHAVPGPTAVQGVGTGWSVSMIAWGCPSDPRTFSGYSRNLATSLREQGMLRHEFSAKNVYARDAFRGAIGVRWHEGFPRLEVRRPWMWSRKASELLSLRVGRHIRDRGDTGAFLQVGTLVNVEPALGRHCVLTDMTIPQAVRARKFAIGSVTGRKLDEAIEVQRDVLLRASHVFTLSEWTRAGIVDEFGIDGGRVTSVYGGPNLRIPEGIKEPRREREILFVGIDWERKGGPLLLEAFAKVRRRFPDATLRIVGCAPEARGREGVIIEGFLSRSNPQEFEKLARCYLRASCFCLPSLFDPFPNAIIEAASVGLPTVAFDNGSRREAVQDGETGILAAQTTSAALADALCDVLSDVIRCHQMGLQAQAYASTHFSWGRTIQRMIAATTLSR
jgi:glycosyltransferase involved in cell wall biosynthesis